MLFLAISLQYRLFVCASLFGFRDQTSVFFGSVSQNFLCGQPWPAVS